MAVLYTKSSCWGPLQQKKNVLDNNILLLSQSAALENHESPLKP